MLLCPTDGERPSVFEHQDDRLAGCNDGFEQLLLIARQIEAGAVKALPRDALPLPQTEDDSVRLLRNRDCGCNVAARIEGDRRLRDDRANSIEQADMFAVGFAFVVAIARYVGVGSDDSDVLDRLRERRRSPSFFSSVIDSRADSSERARCGWERCTRALSVGSTKG